MKIQLRMMRRKRISPYFINGIKTTTAEN